jgi:tetratricopeptide (TPR) repeat protein
MMIAGNDGMISLTDRIAIVFDELEMAIKWDRPCILFAVYQSEYVKEVVQSVLRHALLEQGNEVLHYRIDKAHNDVALDLRDQAGRKRSVFFISGLRWGGGKGRANAYHALNMHREYLVEENIRSIFWLTKKEARLLPRYAPDFWAFRYNVIEFLDYPSKPTDRTTEPPGVDYQHTVERLLTRLSKAPDDVVLHKKIAGLYIKLGFFEDALTQYYRILRISPKEINTWLEIAEVYKKMDRADITARILKKVSGLEGFDITILKKLELIKPKR